MVRRLVVPMLALSLLVPACGGGDDDDKSDVEQTVRDFVKATNDGDADAFCDKLVTQEFLEQATGAEGDKAQEACKKEISSVVGVKFSLVDIKKTTVDGDTASVTAVLKSQGREQPPRVLRLKKEDGDWKLAGGRGG